MEIRKNTIKNSSSHSLSLSCPVFTNISTSFWYLLLLTSSSPVLKKTGEKTGENKSSKKSSRIAQLDGELIRAGERAIQLLQQTTKRFSFFFFCSKTNTLHISVHCLFTIMKTQKKEHLLILLSKLNFSQKGLT